MLDTETRKRIDSARDILVGKIPVPNIQVEQITLALLYKFMDDIDHQTIMLGGNPTYFSGDYEKYGFKNIMSKEIGSQTRFNLYSEALEKMYSHKDLPQTFKDIFKNATIPYKDPETLTLFLKEIEYFSYEDSEKLGDAYEYLLSVLSAQGGLGQFRTPRHIIDFIVKVVNPNKDSKILDPACGTAGFLISAYKHILEQNKNDKEQLQLDYNERIKILDNITGYDIEPSMVKIAEMNMFLHGCNNPQIHEYDTLTSDDRWDEKYDIILANPPFMSPKGGITPHKRFSIKANRSEVLFVDYIMEHLKRDGRAGIIVPEGIVFQTANAYKDLRKQLIDSNLLYAVISLPSGVFQPYSGVKTSILLLDKTLAKQTDSILFIKAENDGYSLGANRSEIKTNDLPKAIEILSRHKEAIVNNEELKLSIEEEKIINIVTKEELQNTDYILVGDRYRRSDIIKNSNCNMVKLGDICLLETGSRPVGGAITHGVMSIGGEQISSDGNIKFDKMKYITEEHYNKMNKGKIIKGDILLVKDGATTGKVGYYNYNSEKVAVNEHVYILRTNERCKSYYLYNILKAEKFKEILKNYIKGIIGGISSEIKEIEIPLLSVEMQNKIVAEIEQYQKIIDGAKQIVDNWKPNIEINSEFEEIELGKITELITKGTTPTTIGFKFELKGINFIKVETISEKGVIDKRKLSYISEECDNSMFRSKLKENDVLFSIAGTKMGITAIVTQKDLPANTNQALAIIRPILKKVNSKYLYYYLQSENIIKLVESLKKGVAQSNLSLEQMKNIKIQLPSVLEQANIVEIIEREETIVESTKKMIDIYENKIKEKINNIWSE